MIKKLLSVLGIALITLLANAQDYKFGKISKEELQETSYSTDSAAVARILYKTGNLKMIYDNGWWYELEIEQRTKIYDKNGFEYATISIPIYSGGSKDESVSGFKASIYNLVNDKIEETKVKRNDDFEENVNKYYTLKKYTFPNVAEGSVLEYKYTIRSPFVFSLPEWKFQYAIPASNVEYVVRIPEYLNYKEFNKGYYPVSREEEMRNTKMTFSYVYNEPGTSAIRAQNTKRAEEELQEKKTTYFVKNIPGLDDENYVNNIDNYRTAVRHELSYTKMPNTTVEYFNTSWDDVTKKIYQSETFGGELNKSNYFEDAVDAITASANSDMERIGMIFSYLKKHMNWNGYNGKYVEEGVKKAFKEKTGNVAEINLMLTAMLRYAKINANPVLSSTRSHGIPLFPTTDGFNYVLCAVEVPNGVLLLDATDKFSMPNILPERALNWSGRLVREDGSSNQIPLTPSSPSKDLLNVSGVLKIDGSVTGKLRRQYSDQLALSYRNQFARSDKEAYKDYLQNNYDDIVLDSLEIKNTFELSKPIIETFSFQKENASDVIGDKIYVDPILFLGMNENPFKTEKREFPIDYSFPRLSRTMISIQIPEGYKIDYLPESISLKMPDGVGSFKLLSSISGSTININVTHSVNFAVVSPAYYTSIKEFYAQIIQKETDKIVLTKA